MLNLAQVQTTDALYTNESIHFNNRSPIWQRGPSSTLYPGRGSHSCFHTAVHCELPGPRINCFDPTRPPDKRKDFSSHTHFFFVLQKKIISLSELSEEFSRWPFCARPDAGDCFSFFLLFFFFALGQCLLLVGEYICYRLRRKCEWILLLFFFSLTRLPKHHTSSALFLFHSSVKAQCVLRRCGWAQRLRVGPSAAVCQSAHALQLILFIYYYYFF